MGEMINCQENLCYNKNKKIEFNESRKKVKKMIPIETKKNKKNKKKTKYNK